MRHAPWANSVISFDLNQHSTSIGIGKEALRKFFSDFFSMDVNVGKNLG